EHPLAGALRGELQVLSRPRQELALGDPRSVPGGSAFIVDARPRDLRCNGEPSILHCREDAAGDAREELARLVALQALRALLPRPLQAGRQVLVLLGDRPFDALDQALDLGLPTLVLLDGQAAARQEQARLAAPGRRLALGEGLLRPPEFPPQLVAEP